MKHIFCTRRTQHSQSISAIITVDFTLVIHRRRSPDVVVFAFQCPQSSQCCTQLGCLDHIITMFTCLLFFTLELTWFSHCPLPCVNCFICLLLVLARRCDQSRRWLFGVDKSKYDIRIFKRWKAAIAAIISSSQ